MKNLFSFIFEVAKIVIIALAIVVPVRYFLFQPFFVRGQSMEPNFEDGDYLIVDEISYRFRDPARGEVVVFKFPNDPSQRYIKRIIGLPKETVTIKNGQVAILDENGKKVVLDESKYIAPGVNTSGNLEMILENDEFFVLGDNRLASSDSRRWGVLPKENIIGRVLIRAWPFAELNIFAAPQYFENRY